ncbi:hypothetical protein ASD15_22890 [Massilia sp. Root351]|uniref:hypothetical protein n=1 Tax=Massilia sp. Root351 TaxID=1736522 RepID=UPI0007093990|nr:hypothetical protein [Massilia sp. Root351]KQV78647.1 hypothetical protein ASD15_22890 [Massilia sp. Root351]
MEDLKEPEAARPAPVHSPAAPAAASAASPAAARPRRKRWISVLLYLLAACGLLFLGIVAYAMLKAPAPKARIVIDEAAVIDSVMSSNYGKYSPTKKGWLYVGEDNRTYLMRVVQQARLQDGADGDELYFIASGASVTEGDQAAVYGVFYIRPDLADGGLSEISSPAMHAGTRAVQPEDVRFEALSDNLWGWVVKTRDGEDPRAVRAVTHNVVLAPNGTQIATLAEFLAAAEHAPEDGCAGAQARYDAYQAEQSAAAATDDSVTEPEYEEPLRCEKRRWSYRTATVNGSVPVPFTVTLSGMMNGAAVEAKNWKLMFDTKSFSYNVPEELKY